MKYIFLILLAITILIYLLNRTIQEGFSTLKQYNVIFGATLRDVEEYLEKILDHIDRCGQKFNTYALVIYENDSKDNTRKILETKKKENYFYIIEDGINEPLRTARIANGRNKVVEKVNELNATNAYQYLIILDMDDVNVSGKFVDTIDTCFSDMNWDVLTGNQSTLYYDMWALRKKGLLDWDCMIEHSKAVASGMPVEESDRKNIHVISKFDAGQRIDVDSAFGGVAIYKLSSIGDCRYNGRYEDGNEKCEHVDFHKCIKDNGGSIFINTDFLTY